MSTPDHYTHTSGSDAARTSGYEERRRWPRVADQEHSRIWFSTAARGAQYGQLQDISLGGLAISVPDASQLQPGRRVVIGLGEWMIPATVKHVAGGPPGGYRVGMEWVRTGSAAVTTLVDQFRQAAELSGTVAVEDAGEYEQSLSAHR